MCHKGDLLSSHSQAIHLAYLYFFSHVSWLLSFIASKKIAQIYCQMSFQEFLIKYQDVLIP